MKNLRRKNVFILLLLNTYLKANNQIQKYISEVEATYRNCIILETSELILAGSKTQSWPKEELEEFQSEIIYTAFPVLLIAKMKFAKVSFFFFFIILFLLIFESVHIKHSLGGQFAFNHKVPKSSWYSIKLQKI